jgi:hypothetical protein
MQVGYLQPSNGTHNRLLTIEGFNLNSSEKLNLD